mmetsp:Transcript_23372/g.54082  ORF Transcript_23372/g.54082 Transcript_23372/m.54082 type:complete len:385 (-) Transcript_23372:842-1996(-)
MLASLCSARLPRLSLLREALLDVPLLSHLLDRLPLLRLLARALLLRDRAARSVGRLSLLLFLVEHRVQLLHELVRRPLLGFGDDRPALEGVGALLVLFGLALERQSRLQRLGDGQLIEAARGALDRLVKRVGLTRRSEPQFGARLRLRLHPQPATRTRRQEGRDRVVEGGERHRHPGLEENEVGAEHLILERRSESAFAFGRSLHLASNARDGADGGALKLGDLERRVEHAFDEGRVLEDVIRLAHQLELLDDLHVRVELEHNARRRHAEGAPPLGLVAKQPRVGRRQRAVESRVAVHVLRRVLEEALPQVGVLGVIERQRLEAAPADREDERVRRLEHFLMPPMLLEPHRAEAQPLLAREQSADEHGQRGIQVVDELARHAMQ